MLEHSEISYSKPILEEQFQLAQKQAAPSYYVGTIYSNPGFSVDQYNYSERESYGNNAHFKGTKNTGKKPQIPTYKYRNDKKGRPTQTSTKNGAWSDKWVIF